MPIRILNEADVHTCLPPAACAEAMEQTLAALARGELSFPLRSVFRAEGSQRVPRPDARLSRRRSAAVRAEGGLHLPREPGEARDRRAPGRRPAVRRRDGRAHGGRRRRGAHRRPHRSRDRGRDAGARTAGVERPRDHRRRLAGTRTPRGARGGDAARARARSRAARSPTPRTWPPRRRRAIRSRSRPSARSPRPMRGADVVVTVSTTAEPIVDAEHLEPGMHVNLVGSSIARDARDHGRGTRAHALLRRSARVDRQRVGRLPDGAARGRDRRVAHPSPSSARCSRASPAGRTSPDEITAFKSLGIAVEDLAAAELAIANAEAAGIGTVAPW